jgi:hypothetical protein
MREKVRTSETSVNFNVTTRRYIPEDSKLRREFNFQKFNLIVDYENAYGNLNREKLWEI